MDVAVDTAGNVYVADSFNNRIRKITLDGMIMTVAGTGDSGYNGDGIPATSATLSLPSGIAVDRAGSIYIADQLNNRVRKVSASGTITDRCRHRSCRILWGWRSGLGSAAEHSAGCGDR